MSSDVRTAIQDLVDTFVVELEALVRRAALETVAEALGAGPAPTASGNGRGRMGVRGGPRPLERATRPAAAPSRKTPASDAGRVRRSADEIEATADRIVAHVEQHQGAKSEDIRAALGLAKNEWQLTVKRLIEAGRLATRGEKRSTVYFTKSSNQRLGVLRRPGRGAPPSPPGAEPPSPQET